LTDDRLGEVKSRVEDALHERRIGPEAGGTTSGHTPRFGAPA
jgi:hypothetical protein